jgi:xanthine/uracil permease
MDWKAVIGTVAPWIATALSGPLGGAAVTAAADALGLSDKTESALKQALSGVTPEQMLALKNADQAFQIRIEELGISREQLSFQDRDSARKRESTVGDKTNRNLAYTIIAAFIAMAIGTLMGWAKADSVLAGTIIGYLSAKAEQVLSYYFGSTSGSAEKSRLLAQSVPPQK